MLNPFFLQGSKTEQGLVQDLINEQLKMYGVEIHYLPRKFLTTKPVIREVIQSVFNNAYPIEAYVENYEGYGDNNVILSKFGIQATNELAITISRERFETYISPLIKQQSNIKLSSRPKEGDLIYFPLGDRLFEIKFVEHEQPFYQLQKTYTYTLKCELFRYENEVIDTEISYIDDNISGIGTITTDGGMGGVSNTQILTMVGIGSTARAITTIVNGGIRSITITNRGGGYTSIPTVGITSASTGGQTGIATAIMISGITVCNDNINPVAKSVQEIQIINPGYGYTVTPKVRIFGGGGSGATATATIADGIVGIITVVSAGSGYTSAPSVTFVGVASTPAQATAIISDTGRITSIRITNSGVGYTQAPDIIIGSPSVIGSGTYSYNEIITGNSSGVTARVRSWNAVTGKLEISNITGTFIKGEIITGSDSGATYSLSNINDNSINDEYSDNEDIEIEADKILDFSESNPFGVP